MASIRHHVGMVTDEPFLFSASIHDNIAYARPDASVDEVVAAARAANAHDFILELSRGLRHGRSASGATRCRAASASGSPSPAPCSPTRPCSILDDATSAIDVRVEAEIHAALERLPRTAPRS